MTPPLRQAQGQPSPLPRSVPLPHTVRQIASTGNYFCYNKNGNMTSRTEGGVTYTQNFDVENRLTSVVKSGGGATTFVYDADGQRMKTVEPSGKTIYYPFPGFEVEVNGPVTMKRVTYSLGGQTIAQRELGLGLAENYDDGNAAGWTAHSGSWSMQNSGSGYAYQQTNTANTATNSSYALTQSGAMAYEWQAMFNSGSTAGGLHFMGSTAADTNHGNSYLVWQDATSMRIHESVSNVLSPAKATVSLPASNGQTYQYRVTYNVGSIGRFASADTLVPDPANPQSYNRYAYVLNRALNFTDPTGHRDTPFDESGGGGVGGGARLPILSKEEAEKALKTIGRGAVTIASVLPVAGDVIDVVDFSTALIRGDFIGAGTTAGFSLLPGSTRIWRGVGGEVVEFAGKHWDEAAAAINRLCSFSADTLVMTENGLVPMSEVTLWTLVLAYNEETGEVGYYPVVAVWSHEDPVIVFLTIDGETIVTPPNHPFFTADGEWEQAANLQPGDEIRDAAWGTGTVETITFTATPQTMYNFTVATAHTYFVGEQQWLVHNDCAGLITRNWDAISVTDARCQTGCEAVAEKIQGFVGGDIYHLSPNQSLAPGATSLGPFDGLNVGWTYHEVVVRDGRVYDAFTGSAGQTFEDYLARWDYGDAIQWTPKN